MATAPPTAALKRRSLRRTFTAHRRVNTIMRPGRLHSRHRGLSLIEMLLSLAISAMLLTATMVALDISFRAYADAAEQAGTQAATRMVTNRLLTLMRTSTAHEPVRPFNLPDTDPENPFDFDLVATLNGDVLTSNFINVFDPDGNDIFVAYDAAQNALFLSITPPRGRDTGTALARGRYQRAVLHQPTPG